MTDPIKVHAEALADLDEQIGDPFMPDPFRRLLRGNRRILQRHAPEERRIESPLIVAVHWRCKGCGKPWEDCEDWRDAAGQPETDTPAVGVAHNPPITTTEVPDAD